MADKINGYGRTGVDITSTRLRAIERGEDARQSRKSESASSGDDVQLTRAATSLKSVEAQLANLPDVDRARVEALRQRIESGSYRMDANRIADRLMRFERELN
ncbi:MAG: flagellar biosynthesis anti-sigma factor FlgM [Gammaproteobacteria bacterium]|jgi:negative regulator of flagellin synthesis FlgM|nr:flagellar biosynthesis anti-sigma factor FlgM [Gammaproteobacteria bacterium]